MASSAADLSNAIVITYGEGATVTLSGQQIPFCLKHAVWKPTSTGTCTLKINNATANHVLETADTQHEFGGQVPLLVTSLSATSSAAGVLYLQKE